MRLDTGKLVNRVVDRVGELREYIDETIEATLARIRIAWRTGLKPWEIDANRAIILLGHFEAYNYYKTKSYKAEDGETNEVRMPVLSREGVLELIVSSTIGIYHTSGVEYYYPDRSMREILPRELVGVWISTHDESKFFQSEVTHNYLRKTNQPSAQQ